MEDAVPETDERIEGKPKKRPDLDAELLRGCITIGTLSLLVYGLTIAPFYFTEHHTYSGLARTGLLGAAPALVLGALAVRRLGLSGATGLMGGAAAGAIFIYLRMEQVMLGYAGISTLPMPEIPPFWSWLLPLIWVLVCLAAVLLLYPKNGQGTVDNRR